MTNLCSEDQIQRMLALKIRESIMDLMLASEGDFEFQDGAQDGDPSIIPVAIEIGAIVKEGLDRLTYYRKIRKVIPTNAYRFEAQKSLIPADIDRQSTDALVIEQVNQGLSVEDIVLKFHSLDYPILRRIFELVQRGWLKVIEPVPPSTPAEIPEFEIEIETDALISKETIDQAVVESLRRELLVPNRVPRLLRTEVLKTGSHLTPAQRYLLGRMDGKRSLLSIIMVSPLKEIDALKTVSSLIKAGVVKLA